MDWSGEACDSSLLGFTRSCRGRRGVATTAVGPGVTPGLVLSGGPELVLGTCESPTYKSTRGAISSGGAPLRSRPRALSGGEVLFWVAWEEEGEINLGDVAERLIGADTGRRVVERRPSWTETRAWTEKEWKAIKAAVAARG